MGFFSWLSAKSGESIPAYPYAERPKYMSEVVLVLPDDSLIEGIYGGYGDITADDGHKYDIYTVIAEYLDGYDGTGREYIFKAEGAFDKAHDLIKIVRKKEYNGERWDQLKPSQNCPDQGYFYEEDQPGGGE